MIGQTPIWNLGTGPAPRLRHSPLSLRGDTEVVDIRPWIGVPRYGVTGASGQRPEASLLEYRFQEVLFLLGTVVMPVN